MQINYFGERKLFMKTSYHAKYLANRLMLKYGEHHQNSMGRTLYDASIQLNPHQVEAALFCFQSVSKKGVILGDEVGLGKTIEAGLVIAQSWSEMKRRILIVAPLPLLKQWQLELKDKFVLESKIIDTKTFNSLSKTGMNPFDQENQILITSYGVAQRHSDSIERAGFELAILDEAHKLRTETKTHKELKKALVGVKKVLLTATPIQNYLEDFYYLCSFIDDEAFGGKDMFGYLYRNSPEEFKIAIQPYLHRTLRKQVADYVKYPNRIVRVYNFNYNKEEKRLYEAIRLYLEDDAVYSFRNNRNALIKTTIQKQLASSTAALISTLEKIKARLEKAYLENDPSLFDSVDWEVELETNESDDELEEVMDKGSCLVSDDVVNDFEKKQAIQHELQVIRQLIALAQTISVDSRALKLMTALPEIFKGLEQQEGANKKVLIFTESVKTQNFLYHFLKENGFEKVVRFSGQNNTEDCQEIYNRWKENHQFSEGKATAMREALINEFRDWAEIMIATEAGSEGLNLQFCSTVINYDLPWNPQRIEQRIGRCHRYGQPVDVTVLNFINQDNLVEKRMYELLTGKFDIFQDLFKSSDEVLGFLEQGNRFEKRIAEIYRQCRTATEVDEAFEELQQRYQPKINQKLKETKQALKTYFDEEVSLRFKTTEEAMQRQLTVLEKDFWELTQIQLHEVAYFKGMEEEFKFLLPNPYHGISAGIYQLHTHFNPEREEDVILYRTNSSLGEVVIQEALNFKGNLDYIEFDLTHYDGNISYLNQYKGLNGYLIATKLRTKGVVNQERILLNCLLENRAPISQQILPRLFDLDGVIKESFFFNPYLENELKEMVQKDIKRNVNQINEENNSVYQLRKKEIVEEYNVQKNALSGMIEELNQKQLEVDYKLINAVDEKEEALLERELEEIYHKLKELREFQTVRENEFMTRRQSRLKALRGKLEYEAEELFVIRFKIV